MTTMAGGSKCCARRSFASFANVVIGHIVAERERLLGLLADSEAAR